MKKISWHTETRKIKDLSPFEGNPRKISPKDAEELRKSLERFGLADIPVIQPDGTIIGGHQRIEILKQAGEKEIEIRVPDHSLSQKEFTELNLRLNKNQGEWDKNLIAKFDEEILASVGFTKDEMDSFFGLDFVEDFDLNAEKEKLLGGDKMRTELGQVWQLGEHRLAVGDATDKKCWENVLGKEKFDMIFTDPPYRLAYSKKRTRKVKTKDGFKLKREREYESVGSTDKKGKSKFRFGMKGNRMYEGVEMQKGVPEFDAWLSIANEYQNEICANVMIFESWKNTPDLWRAMEKYWKIKNMVIWHAPNRMQGFSTLDSFYNKYDIAIYGENGNIKENEIPEEEMEQYILDKGQKLIESYDIAIYGHTGGKADRAEKGRKEKWGKVSDHVTANVGSVGSSNQNIVFGTKPIQILLPYMKALSPRGGLSWSHSQAQAPPLSRRRL